MKVSHCSERSSACDVSTGAEVIQWTRGPGKNHHLYFTTHSVTADDRWLVFLSERDGHPNLYAIDRRDGAICRMSNNASGTLRSYVYPLGGLVGLSKVSPCLDPFRNRLFYIRDDRIFQVNLDDPEPEERSLGALPAGWYGGFTHVSADGRTLCIPVTDPRAFADEKTQWDQLDHVPGRMAEAGLVTRLYFLDIEAGAQRIAAEVPFWVTHVQFDPAGSLRMIFNLEGSGDGGPLPDRIWCLETDGTFRPLAPEARGEWRSHENWAPDGRSILYHGSRDGQAFVAARTWEGDLLHETAIDGVEFWHATGLPDGRRLAVDRRDGMISLIDPQPAPGQPKVRDLCRHDTTIEDQDTHAHPITALHGRSLLFSSDRSGDCQVYEVALPGADAAPDSESPRQAPTV